MDNFIQFLTHFALVFSGVFRKNLEHVAEKVGLSPTEMMQANPFASVVPWVLVHPEAVEHDLLSNTRSILVAILVWNGKKKSYEPDLYRVTWAADKYGLPVSCTHVTIARVEEGDPSIILGYIEKGHGANASQRVRFCQVLVSRFFFSGGTSDAGGRLSSLGEYEAGLARKMCQVGDGSDFASYRKDMKFVPEFRMYRGPVQDRIAEFCAPKSREERLAAENRNLKTALDEQQAAIEAQRAEMAAMQAQMAAMMEMLKQQQNA